jgi:SulP family sulfate permease
VLPRWLVGVGFGLLLVIITHRFKHYLVMPGLLVGGVLVFHIAVFVIGKSVHSLHGSGWLLGPFPSQGSWEPLSIGAIQHADWSVIASQWGDMTTVFVIAVVSVLLNSCALELVVKTDIDLNRELQASGAANILVGLGGGTVGFHSLAMSRLVHGMGSKSRLVGVIGAAMCGVMLLVGTAPLAYLPRAVLGGLLFFLGMHFLIEWVYEAYFRLTKADYAVVIMILLIVATLGYLPAVMVGFVACVILFLVNYSRVDVVKQALTGRDRRSNVDRPNRHARILQKRGDQLRIFRLQGFIFFGTANGLFDQVRELVEEEGHGLRFLVFDFKRVTGVDSSSVLSFIKISQLAETRGFMLLFIGLSKSIRRLLRKEGFEELPPEVYRRFDDLDHALEWCENALLEEEGFTFEKLRNLSFVEHLEEELEGVDTERFRQFFERLEIDKGEVLVRQGEESDALYVLDQGQVTAELELADGKTLRLRTMYSGTIVGEMGLILQEPRSASVVADRRSIVYRLTSSALAQMEAAEPDLAAAFYAYLTRLMAERLANSNRTLRHLLQ